MITKQTLYNHQCTGKPLIYDYGFNEYVTIRPTHITKTQGKHFWFEAMIEDNKNISDKKYYAIGSIHSFSNAFISESLKQKDQENEKYKKTQIKFLKSFI